MNTTTLTRTTRPDDDVSPRWLLDITRNRWASIHAVTGQELAPAELLDGTWHVSSRLTPNAGMPALAAASFYDAARAVAWLSELICDAETHTVVVVSA